VSPGGSITSARRFTNTLKIMVKSAMRRLAIGSLPPSGSSSGTQKRLSWHVPPGGYV